MSVELSLEFESLGKVLNKLEEINDLKENSLDYQYFILVQTAITVHSFPLPQWNYPTVVD